MRHVHIPLIIALTGAAILAAGFAAALSQADPHSEPKLTASPAFQDQASHPTPALELPISFERRTGDLDAMVKRREIRALVVPSRSGFFYDKGHPRGIYFEALDEFQRFVNERFRTGTLKINVTYIPVRPEQLENALTEGVGDLIAYGVEITPEREKKVLFTTPIDSNVKQVIVTGPSAPPIASLEDLSGKEIYVNPLTVYYQNLQDLSESLQKAGKPPILVKKADPNLTDEDLLEMVNAGLIPATVTINIRAEFWSKVFLHLDPSSKRRLEGRGATCVGDAAGQSAAEATARRIRKRTRSGHILRQHIAKALSEKHRVCERCNFDRGDEEISGLRWLFQKVCCRI